MSAARLVRSVSSIEVKASHELSADVHFSSHFIRIPERAPFLDRKIKRLINNQKMFPPLCLIYTAVFVQLELLNPLELWQHASSIVVAVN